MFFKHFASKNQLPGCYISGTLVENGLMKIMQTDILRVRMSKNELLDILGRGRLAPVVFSKNVTPWKVSKYGVFSGPYFPAFGLNNTERYRISPYSVRMRENTDLKKLRIWTLFMQWMVHKDWIEKCKKKIRAIFLAIQNICVNSNSELLGVLQLKLMVI